MVQWVHMNKTALSIAAIIVIILGVGAYMYFAPHAAAPEEADSGQDAAAAGDRTFLTAVTYSCDEGRTITASYYEGPEAPEAAPGEMPTPTGSVDVAIGDEATTTLSQTISADGIRYASADESLVFWSKGDSALVMRDNSMDLDYTNCEAVAGGTETKLKG